MFLTNKNKSGFGLIEIVVASSIISLTIFTLLYVYTTVSKYSNSNVHSLKAIQLGEETVEILKYLRDSGWDQNIQSLTLGAEYHPYWDTDMTPHTWTLTSSNILLEDKYEVSIVFSSVYRDPSHNVVSSGGTLDAESRKANINVSWRQNGATTTKSMETYIFNIFDN